MPLHFDLYCLSFFKMKFLVSGASGFIGGHLVRRLSEKGLETRAFVRPTSNIEKLKSLRNVEIFYGDLTDFSSVKRAVEGIQIVYHLGGLVSDWGDYEKFYEVNYRGTQAMLKASLEASVKKFIYTSSIGVLDLSGKGIVRENQAYGHFSGSYCRSKAEAEKFVRKYSQVLQTVIIRPAVVFGPEDSQCTLRSLKYARRHLLFTVNKGKSIFPHLYVGNLVQALLLASQVEIASGEIFNLTDGAETSAKEFFSHINRIASRGEIHLSLPYPIAWLGALLMDFFSRLTGKPPLLSWTALEFLRLKCQFDISKAREKLEYNPSIRLNRGMKEVKLWWDSLL